MTASRWRASAGGFCELLTDGSLSVAARVRALADQQARHNLGDLYRTINVPTLALGFLLPDRQPRFRYKRSGSTDVRGTPCGSSRFRSGNVRR